MPGASKSQKGRKIGRNSDKCKRYQGENRRVKNKARRAETLANRLVRAAERRMKPTRTDPVTGKVTRAGVVEDRVAADKKVLKKQAQRLNFRKLSKKEQREHREHGSRQFA